MDLLVGVILMMMMMLMILRLLIPSNFDDILSCSTLLTNYFRGSRGQRSKGFGSETGAEMDADR